MGARHALFKPFAAPRTVEIPESPRAGMEQIGKPGKGGHKFAGQQFWDCGARAEAAPRRVSSIKIALFLGCGSAPKSSKDGRRDPVRHAGDILADEVREQRGREGGAGHGCDQDRHRNDRYPQVRLIRRAMRHDRTGARLANAPVPDRPRARRAATLGPSRAPRSHELRAGGHSPRAHRSRCGSQ